MTAGRRWIGRWNAGAVSIGLGLACGAVLAVYLIVIVVPAARHPNTNGFASYYTASKTLIEHPEELPRVYDNPWFQRQINAAGFVGVVDIHNTQPPTMSLMLAAIAWISPGKARVVWIALSVALWLGGLALLSRTLGLRDHSHAVRSSPPPPWLLLAASTAGYVPLADNLRQGQCYALLFFLLCLFVRLAARPRSERDWVAGIPLGVIAVVKLAGLWLWPLLLLSRRRRVLLGAGGTAAALILCSLPLVGWAAWRPFLRDLPRLTSDPVRYLAAYQTVTSLMGHLFIFDARWNPYPAVALKSLGIGLTLLVGAGALLLSARVQRLDDEAREGRILSLALILSLVVSVAPIAESYHYLLVLPALVVACWWAARGGVGAPAWVALAAATALLIVPHRLYTAPLLGRGWLALFAYPRLYGAFLLWGWLAIALHQVRTRPAPGATAVGQRQP